MTILDTITAAKKEEVARRKQAVPIADLEKKEGFKRTCYSLKQSLLDLTRTGIIAEFKRQSPSKGIIHANARPEDVTSAYARYGASALSVLTDEPFFGGTYPDFAKARQQSIPLLRKDFMVDEYQIVESKAWGADVILLIAACLTPKEVSSFATLAHNLGMEVLLEIHSEEELEHVCNHTRIIGINNRNLKDFKVDIQQSIRLSTLLPPGSIKVAESGIHSVETLRDLKSKGFQGFLMGEYFMKAPDPGEAFKNFVTELGAEL